MPAPSPYLKTLRSMTGRDEDTPDDDMPALLARLWATADGRAFLCWLWGRTVGQQIDDDAPDGALRAYAARNSLAALIFQLLERGLVRDPRG